MQIKRLSHSLSILAIASLLSGGLAPGSSRVSAQKSDPEPAQVGRGVIVSPPVLPADTRGLPPAPTVRTAADLALGEEAPVAPLRPHLKPRPDASFNEPLSLGGSPDPLVRAQEQAAAGPMPGLSVGFQGISNLDGYFPPDPNGAVGLNHFVQMVNVSTQIFDKQGNSLYGPFHPNNLWPANDPCNRMNDGDVVALYDQLADRWLLTQFAIKDGLNGGGFYQCIAVSSGPTPTNLPSDWYLYTFAVHPTKMNDYPKFSVWPDGYYMTANQFEGGTTWAGVGLWVFDRGKMLNGQAATFQYRDLVNTGLDFASVLPANLLGVQEPPAGSPDYALTVDDGSFTGGSPQLIVLEMSARWPGGLTVSIADQLPVASFTWLKQDIPQKGTSLYYLDAISDRLMMHAYYRNMGSYEVLTANHTVDAGGGRAGIRWYELRKYADQSNWQIYQQGTYAPLDDINRWMGSLAVDRQGNMALGYSVSGVSLYPGIRYAGRLASDPPGVMAQDEMVMVDGGGYQTRLQNGIGRWGDYSAMSVDPADDCTFWYTNEYIPFTGLQPWRTWIGAFKFPDCGPLQSGTITGQVTDSSSGNPLAGVSIHGAGSLPTHFFQATSQDGGVYSALAPEDVYTVTVSTFGYWPQEYPAVSITSGMTTTLNVGLIPAPVHTLSGTVRDELAGWPLYARIQIDGYPGAALWTDPQSGAFSISLPEFVTYTLQAEAFSPGYIAATIPIGQLTSDKVVDVSLSPDLAACSAPGYAGNAQTCQEQHGGLAVGNVRDGNTLDGLNGATVSEFGGDAVLTVGTPDDPTVGDGFYILFVSTGSQEIQAGYSRYTTQLALVSVPSGKAVRQDFSLPAGMLSIQPPVLTAIAEVGTGITLPLAIANTGSAPLQFLISERDPAFAPANLAFRRSYNPPLDNTDNNSATRRVEAPVGTGIMLQQIDLTAVTNHLCLLGIEFALGSYWVTSGGQTSCNDPNYLIEISPQGQVLNTYIQPTLFSTFGWGDLAFDGAYLYASHTNLIQQIDPQTGQVTGVIIPAPVDPVRALAYDPASDHFWAANQTSGIYEIDRQGNIIKHLPSLLNIYGLAYDPGAPGGPALWAWSQDGIPMILANRIDPLTGELLASFSGMALGGIDQAGGATFTDTLFPGKRVLLAMQQAIADSAVAYDLGPVYQTDLPWVASQPAAGTIEAGRTLPITVTLQSDLMGVLKADLMIDNDTPYGTLTIPVTFTVTGITLTTPFLTRTALPGSTIVFTMTLSNYFPIADTFDLSLGASSYPDSLSQPSVDVNAWESGSFQVQVHVPAVAMNGDQDSVTITATSQANPNRKITLELVTQVMIRLYYFPFIINDR